MKTPFPGVLIEIGVCLFVKHVCVECLDNYLTYLRLLTLTLHQYRGWCFRILSCRSRWSRISAVFYRSLKPANPITIGLPWRV